jgi:pimeloyl-ACP methyl ester carboxylesterase
MSVIILQDEIIHYEVLGRGRPVLFLHDWVGSWRYWIPAMQAASLSFRAYALDLWGFGDTAKNPNYYALEHQTNLLAGFMEYLGINKVAIVGHGLGAIVSLLFAANQPQSVDRILAVGYPSTENSINNRLRTSSPAELAEWLIGKSPGNEAVILEALKTDPEAVQRSLTSLTTIDLDRLVTRQKNPLLMVHGLSDPMVALPDPDQTSNLPDNAHLILFEQCGHFPMLDEPSKFNRLLADFFSLNSDANPRQLQLKEEWRRRVR